MTYYIKNNVVIDTLPEYVEYVDVSETPEGDDASIVENVIRKLATECNSIELENAGYYNIPPADVTYEQLVELGHINVNDPLPDFDPELEYIEWDGQQYIVLKNIKGQTSKPEHDPVWEKCIWQKNEWVVTPSDAAIERYSAWTHIIELRVNMLNSTDYIIDEYDNMSEEDVQVWKDYRQALRDITQYRTGEIDDWKNVVVFEDPISYQCWKLGLTRAEYEGETI